MADTAVGTSMRRSLSLRRFVLFAGLGGIGTAVHYGVLVFGVHGLGQAPLTASMWGSVFGACVNFLLSHHITFRSRVRHRETAPRFLAVAAMGFGINALTMWLLVTGAALPYIVAQVLATGLVLGSTYVCNAVWTFGARRGEH